MPAKVLVSGVGARVPAFLNTLDTKIDLPVEVLRPGSRLIIDPSDDRLPAEQVVHSMGKALGLAAAALDGRVPGCPMSPPSPRRSALRRLPPITWAAACLLLLVLGLAFVERDRDRRLNVLESGLKAIEPTRDRAVIEESAARIDALKADITGLAAAHEARKRFARIGRLLDRVEAPSVRRTQGDYHLITLAAGFVPGEEFLKARIVTRLGEEELFEGELASIFAVAGGEPVLTGPHPAEEETPPEGMKALAEYDVESDLR